MRPERQKTVMIVEDNKIHMNLMKDILHPAGYATVGTYEGRKAVSLARKHRPDLILMDIQLGDISGLEVTKKLKKDKTLKDIPIIAVTAFAMNGDEKMCFSAGCTAYIHKPISVTVLMNMIGRLIG